MYGHATQTPRMNIWCPNCWSYTAPNALPPRFWKPTPKKCRLQRIFQRSMRPLLVNSRKPMRISAKACGCVLNRVVTMVCPLVRLCRCCARQAISQKPISERSAFRAITVSSNCAHPAWMDFSNPLAETPVSKGHWSNN